MTLEVRNVTKRVGVETHIHETDLTLAPKGFNILLGATNAGKTSLVKMMAGLERPTSGDHRIYCGDMRWFIRFASGCGAG